MIFHKIMLLIFLTTAFAYVFSLAERGGVFHSLCRFVFKVQFGAYVIFFVILGIKHLLV